MTPSPARLRRPDVVVLALGAALVVAAVVRGRVLADAGAVLVLRDAQPLTGPLREGRVGLRYLLPVAVAVAGVALLPVVARRWPYRRLLLASGPLAAVWALALATTDGYLGVFGRLSTRFEYLADVDRVGSPLTFLPRFAEGVAANPAGTEWVTHVAGHPPGALLMFWWLQAVGLGGEVWAALAMVAAGASAVPALLVVARVLGGEALARTLLPFAVLAPAAVWVATSADAAFLGVGAWGVALLALAAERTGRRADVLALAGGLVLGSLLFLSYGAVPLGSVPVVVVLLVRRRDGWVARLRPLAVAALGVAVVAAAYALAGFWWFDGVAATRVRWAQGVGDERPYFYFWLANLAALAIALGPAVLVGLGRVVTGVRSRRPGPPGGWLVAAVVGAAVLSVTASNLGGYSRGEVERIWLPFLPWLAMAAVALGGAHRGWLAAQVGTALTVQAVLVGKW